MNQHSNFEIGNSGNSALTVHVFLHKQLKSKILKNNLKYSLPLVVPPQFQTPNHPMNSSSTRPTKSAASSGPISSRGEQLASSSPPPCPCYDQTLALVTTIQQFHLQWILEACTVLGKSANIDGLKIELPRPSLKNGKLGEVISGNFQD